MSFILQEAKHFHFKSLAKTGQEEIVLGGMQAKADLLSNTVFGFCLWLPRSLLWVTGTLQNLLALLYSLSQQDSSASFLRSMLVTLVATHVLKLNLVVSGILSESPALLPHVQNAW